MSNQKVEGIRKVYNRKILRNKLKFIYKTNKIRRIWKLEDTVKSQNNK